MEQKVRKGEELNEVNLKIYLKEKSTYFEYKK